MRRNQFVASILTIALLSFGGVVSLFVPMDWGGSLVDGGASGTSAQQDQQTQTSGISNGASDWNIFSDFYDDDDDDHDDDHDDDDDDHDDDDHDDDDDDHDDDDD